MRMFERFREASDLDEKSELKQVSSLIYAMWDETKDILDSFRLSDGEQKSYATVKGKFESYFVKKRNISLFRRRQEEGEPAAFLRMTYMPCLIIATLVL